MTPTEKAIAKIEAHERECAIRYEGIETLRIWKQKI